MSQRFDDLDIEGPFEKCKKRVEDFATNLYMALCLEEAIEHQKQIEKEYQDAVAMEDVELMRQKKQELNLCEGTFRLTTALFDLNTDIL